VLEGLTTTIMARSLSALVFAMCMAHAKGCTGLAECNIPKATALMEEFNKESKAHPEHSCDSFGTLLYGSTEGFSNLNCLINGCAGDDVKAADELKAKETAIVKQLCEGVCKQRDDVHFCYSYTTTMTPWDSSASSSGDTDSLESSDSASWEEDRSGDSSQSNEVSGSQASGSSGWYPFIWQWMTLFCIIAGWIIWCSCCYGTICCVSQYRRRQSRKKALRDEADDEDEDDEETELTAAPSPPPVAPDVDDMPSLEPISGFGGQQYVPVYTSAVV
jgi:hypothetical protein